MFLFIKKHLHNNILAKQLPLGPSNVAFPCLLNLPVTYSKVSLLHLIFFTI